MPDEDWKPKRRSNSSAPRSDQSNEQPNLNKSEFQTTYQKDHGYMNHFGKPGSENGNYKRHSFNPSNSHAVGIVPINDLTSFTNVNEAQKVYVDKMSFEHGYDSRTENNYQNKGKVKSKKDNFLKICYFYILETRRFCFRPNRTETNSRNQLKSRLE